MLRRMFLSLIVGLTFTAFAAQANAPMEIRGATTVDADRVIELIGATQNLVIIDTRRAEDYDRGHIEGAVRVLDTEMTPEILGRHVTTRETPVLFYCNGLACGRAAKAAETAIGWGYSRVYYYALGMEEWNRRGLPLVRD